ncbi:plastocyanin/azurin family copper-binding protein [Rhodohalobacter sp. 8-1]|uniref:plastocyanin/azurin family copper-binding protein n=1 Tax=Rhodohalobacter sp. 8-1 TaxID=3131972 RepID=UPI0030EE63E9
MSTIRLPGRVTIFMLAVVIPVLASAIIKTVSAQTIQEEEAQFYSISTLPIPDDIKLEASGLAFNENGDLAVTTRRGEVWMIEDPSGSNPTFQRFAQGLHEPLGIAYKDGSYFIAQRGELVKLSDHDSDDIADRFETIYRWPLTGNYHEYSYGPKFLPDGDMVVTLNLSWVGYGASLTDWRGWMLKITEEGEMTPFATGMRSPAGFGFNNEGEIFYTENQGDWIGSGWMTHLESGDFAGHPEGLRWTSNEGSPLDLTMEEIDDSEGLTLYEQSQIIPEIKNPAAWFPHTIMGISTSDILYIDGNDKVGPFNGQFLVGDQGHSKIMRVALEKVNGEYQGAVFGFREGFQSGIIKLAWGPDRDIYVAMTSRGWGATGGDPYGVQRLDWNGNVPFEMQTIEAESNGFTINFTEPVDPETATNMSNYRITDFTYRYDAVYGSPIIRRQSKTIPRIELSDDRRSARLYIDGMREGYIYEVQTEGILSEEQTPMLHSVGYYSLNNLPEGERSAVAEGVGISTTEETGELSAKKITEMPDVWNGEADVELTLSTEPGLKYDRELIRVDAGSKLALTFNNDDDMAHNVVITKPESADAVGQAAMNLGLNANDLEYVPISDRVLYHTSMLEPGQAETIYIDVPDVPGDYTFVCTFPGHYLTMRGVLRVE